MAIADIERRDVWRHDRGMTSATTIERAWRERYVPSQRRYFAQVRPADHADIIVNNDELQRPAWEVRPRRP